MESCLVLVTYHNSFLNFGKIWFFFPSKYGEFCVFVPKISFEELFTLDYFLVVNKKTTNSIPADDWLVQDHPSCLAKVSHESGIKNKISRNSDFWRFWSMLFSGKFSLFFKRWKYHFNNYKDFLWKKKRP